MDRTTEQTANAAMALRPPTSSLRLAYERPLAVRLALGAAFVALALLLRWPLSPVLGERLPYLTFYPAVMFAVWYGGVAAGVLATVTSAALADLLLLAGARGPLRAGDLIGLLTFLGASIAICVLQDRMQRAALAAARYGARLGRLQAFSAALADAATVDEVAEVAVGEGSAAAGAIAAALHLYDPEGRALRRLAARGLADAPARADATPDELAVDAASQALAVRAVRDGAAVWPERAGGAASTAALPLTSDGRVLGVLELEFAAEPGFDPGDRELLSTLGRQVGHALDRARLFEGEHHANARLAVLAEVGRVLGSAPLESIPGALGRVLVPGFADASVLEIYDEAGAVVAAEAVHVDLARARRMRAAITERGAQSALRGFVEARGPARLSEAALDENRALLEALGGDASVLLVAPIQTEAGLAGALALALASAPTRAEPGSRPRKPRRYGDDDLTLAEEVAARAAVATEQARLHAELQAAVRVRDDFLSVASHELNTPLTPLKMHLGALRRGRADPSKTEERLAALDRQVDRLAQLVGQLLDVSRIAAGSLRVDREPVDLAAIVRETVQRMEGPLNASGSELRLDAPERLVGLWDPMRLDQIATNLLTNAIKYGERRPIDVRLEAVDGASVRLRVQDHGIGIAHEHLARIFGRFERAVSVRHFGGFGLGLWIVRQVVEALGGTIEVESAPGEGATFTVLLPRGEPAPETLLH